MNKSTIYQLSTALAFLFIGFQSSAQDTTSIPNENVEVYKQFRAQVASANPMDISPTQLSKGNEGPITFDYEELEPVFEITYPEPVIKPLSYNSDERLARKNGYLKGGYGNLNSPLIEGQLHYNIQDWFDFGISLRHLSASDEEIDNQEMSDSYFSINAGYFLNPKNKIFLVGSTHLQQRSLYTYADNTQLLETYAGEISDRRFNSYSGSLNHNYNNFEIRGLSSKTSFEYQYYKALNTNNESTISVSNVINKRLSKGLSAGIISNVDYYISNHSGERTKDLLYSLTPSAFFSKNKFNGRFGIAMSNPSGFTFWPSVDASFDINNDFSLSLKSEQKLERNGIQNTYENNFWLIDFQGFESALESNNPLSVHDRKTLSLGSEYRYKKLISGLTISYINDKKLQLFSSDLSGHNDYYLDTERIKLDFNFAFNLNHKLSITATPYYQFFFDKDAVDASYLPDYGVDVRLEQFLLKKRLRMYQSIEIQGERTVLNHAKEELLDLPVYVDLGAGLEFEITQTFRLFGRAGNLWNKRYDLFLGNPTYGVNFHAGLKLVF